MKLNEDPKKGHSKKSEFSVDIKRLPDYQLLEVYKRQSKIIKNKSLINKLPDKGKKLIDKNRIIEEELALRKKTTDDIITSISELSIGAKTESNKSNKDIGKLKSENKNASLSSSCSSLSHEGSSVIEVPTGDSVTVVDRFAYQRSERLDHVPPLARFIPSHSPKSKPSSKQYEESQLSAACLQRNKFDVQSVPLTEVVKLKGRETVYLKELEIKEAQEQLTHMEFSGGSSLTSGGLSYTPMNYRSAPDQDESEEEHEETLVLEEDDDRAGTVSFTVED